MLKIIHSTQAKGSVIALFEGKNKISFSDNKGYLYVINKEKYGMDVYYVDSDELKPLHPYQKSSSFSDNGELVYSIEANGSCAIKLKTPEVSSTRTVQTITKAKNMDQQGLLLYGNDQRAEIISFGGDNNEYIFTGGTDGRIYMYDSRNGNMLSAFKPLPDYIAHIRVGEDAKFIAYSCYNGSLYVSNLRFNDLILQTFPGDIIEDSFFYNKCSDLYAVGRSGTSYIYNLSEKQLLSKKALFPSWPTCCLLEQTGRYALVGTRSGHLHIVNLSNHSIAYTEKLEEKGIVSLNLKETKLMIGFENGTVYYVDVYAYADEFVEALGNKDFAAAKQYLKMNLFLAIHPMSDLFHDAWDEIINEIRELVSKGNSKIALEKATPFIDNASNKHEFDFLIHKQKELQKFSEMVEENHYFEAYTLLESAPYLAKTQSAQKLENSFTKIFNNAKKMLSEDPLRNLTKIQTLLKPFMSIPSKSQLIRPLIKSYQVFLMADEKIKEKDFKVYFTLCEKYPYLKEEATYKRLCDIAEGAIKKITRMIDAHEFNDAISGIRQLVGFLPYRMELSKLSQTIKNRQSLIHFITSDQMKEVYELVHLNPELEKTDSFIEYDKRFDQTLSFAMNYVGQGEIKLTQEAFKDYTPIPRFRTKIKECLRQACFNRISDLLKHNKYEGAKPIVSHYLKEFGKDPDFEKLVKKISNQ